MSATCTRCHTNPRPDGYIGSVWCLQCQADPTAPQAYGSVDDEVSASDLLRADWTPDPEKVREFGAELHSGARCSRCWHLVSESVQGCPHRKEPT